MGNDPITRDTVMAGRLKDAGHADGRDWYATLWQHTTIARLSAIDRHPRRGRGGKSARIWEVDGVACESLEQAIERLNVPPVFTDGEREMLALIPEEWVELRGLRIQAAEELGRVAGADIIMLRHKGAVENELRRENGRLVPWVRRTPGWEAAHG